MEVEDDDSRRCTRARRRRSAPPRCRASPTATSRSSRARTTRARSTTAARSAPTTPARRSTSTCSSTRSTRRRARACRTSSAARAPGTTGSGQEANESTQVLRPVPRPAPRPDQRAGARRGDLRALRARHRDDGRPRSPSAATTSPAWSPTPTRRSRAIGDENAALDRALELLPSTLRKANTTFVNLRSTLDDLDQLVDESKPATQGPGAASCASCARSCSEARPTIADLRTLIRSAGPDNDLIELTAKQPRLAQLTASRLPARRSGRSTRPSRCSSTSAATRPTSPPGSPNFGQVAANYDANGHYARVQPMFLPANYVAAARSRAVDPPPEARRLRDRQPQAAARAAPIQPPPDGSAPARRVDGCDPATTRPAMRRLICIGLFVAIVPWIVIGIVREATDDDTARPLLRARDLRQRRQARSTGEDVKIAGVPVGVVVDELDVTDDKKAAVMLRIDDEDFTPFKADAKLHDPAAVADRREVRGVRARARPRPSRSSRSTSGDGEGERLLPLAQHQLAGRHRPAQRHHAAALPRALRDPAERVRHRPRRARRGAERGHPPRQPGAARDRQACSRSWPTRTACCANLARDSDAGARPARARAHAGCPTGSSRPTRPARPRPSAAPTSAAGINRLPEFLRELRPLMADLDELADQGTPVLRDLGTAAPQDGPPDQGRSARSRRPASESFPSLGDALERGRPALHPARVR